jgi:hypothetical protein
MRRWKTNNCEEGSVRCNFTRRSESGVATGDEDGESSDLEQERCHKVGLWRGQTQMDHTYEQPEYKKAFWTKRKTIRASKKHFFVVCPY